MEASVILGVIGMGYEHLIYARVQQYYVDEVYVNRNTGSQPLKYTT